LSAATNENELTSTLHLGLRQVVDGSADSALSEFLKRASDEDLQAYKSIISAGVDSAMIFIHRGASKGSRFLLNSAALATGVSIGRSKESQIFLDDVTVSRSHAKIIKTDSGIGITDLGSLNGTYVNNQSLGQKDLRSGDEIQIGKFHMIFVSTNVQSKEEN